MPQAPPATTAALGTAHSVKASPARPPLTPKAPYAALDASLRGLAGAAEGFGAAAVGGRDGPVVHVTSLADAGPGSLREACGRKGPLWIVFDVSGDINLASAVRVGSHKTLDGRGVHVRLRGAGLLLHGSTHVIVCNLAFTRGRGDDSDAIQVKPGAQHIWIDRCSLSDYFDGLIDITVGSTDVTVSRCHFFNHDKTMLIGASPKDLADRSIRVSVHACFFDGTRQRHPRVRFGRVHLWNNYTRGWAIYAVNASVEAQILSQCNIYEATENRKAFEYSAEKASDRPAPAAGSLRSEGDLFLQGAHGEALRSGAVFRPQEFYKAWTMAPTTPALIEQIKARAGWQDIPLPPDTRVKGHHHHKDIIAHL